MELTLKLIIFMSFQFNTLDKYIIYILITIIKTVTYNFIYTFIFQPDF